MAYQPMLVIGCGGSGGATIQYMMDNLRTELSRKLAKEGHPSIDRLPGAWQFVHLDVPYSADDSEPNRPPGVHEQGGMYVSLAQPGLTWKIVADQVWNKTRHTRPDLTSGWLRLPDKSDPPLSQGAGQERAVGRGVALNSAKTIYEALKTARSKMYAEHGRNELTDLAQRLGESVSPAALVLIVSSMAGGTGASMVLDVPRILASIDGQLGASTAMFLYTSEVFEGIPPQARRGVEANGLAMMGELLATSMGASEADSELLGMLGINPPNTPTMYRRIFPIGSKHGLQGATFGDGKLESIYRAVGVALAGLTASASAVDAFRTRDLGNPSPTPLDERWMGEGGSAGGDPLLWGTFGYARLSLGRDRYGEYVAQRLSRVAVDRLIAGHRDDRGQTSAEMDLTEATDEAARRLIANLGLSPETTDAIALISRQSVGGGEGARQELIRSMREVAGRQIFDDGQFSGTLAGKAFIRTLRQSMARSKPSIDAELSKVAYAAVFRWHAEFTRDFLTEVEGIATRYGLPVARQVVLGMVTQCASWRQQLSASASSSRLLPFTPDIPDQVAADFDQVAAVSQGHPLQERIMTSIAKRLAGSAEGEMARLIGMVLEDFGPSFAHPLADALALQLRELEQAKGKEPRDSGQSDLKSSLYADWPRPHERVPQRFQGAHNEVVLLKADAFPSTFDGHVAATVHARPSRPSPSEAVDLMVTEILRDRWLGHNDESAQARVILQTVAWVPNGLSFDPENASVFRSKSAARFSCACSTEDIIERARDWVFRADGDFGEYLSVGLAEYLDAGSQEFDERLRGLLNGFESALAQALPLVAINPMAAEKLHRDASELVQVNFKFSAIPFAESNVVRQALGDHLRLRPNTSAVTTSAFENAQNESRTTDFIDVFSAYPPMSPLAFSSLLQPLNSAWLKASSDGAIKAFWNNRRARSLPQCVAMSPGERRAFLAGYVVSKITGRIRGSYRTQPHTKSEPIEVFEEDSESWFAFPNPLLSPFQDAAKQGLDEPAALLEGHLLALAACGHDEDFKLLNAFVTLRHTFGEVIGDGRDFLTANGEFFLRQWLVDGVRPPGAPPAGWDKGLDGQSVDLTSVEGRQQAAVAFLSKNRDDYSEYFKVGDVRANPHFHQFDRYPLLAGIAEDFVWAVEEVLKLVEAITTDATTTDGPMAM